MSDRYKPLPCPFCGSARSELVQGGDDWYRNCCGCGAGTAGFRLKSKAMTAWNRRVVDSRLTDDALAEKVAAEYDLQTIPHERLNIIAAYRRAVRGEKS